MTRPLGLVLGLALLTCGCSEPDSEPSAEDWKPVEGLPEAYAYGAVWSSGPEDAWVTADGGRVFHFDGSTWTEFALETTDMMQGIWAFGPDDMWMVGGQSLARYDGTSWTVTDLRQEAPGIEGLTSIWGSSPSDVWVVGSQSTAAHWDGTTWVRQLAAGPDNTAVWGSGPNDVYTVSVFDVAHWDGSTWTTLEDDLLWGADGVFGFGPDDVWLATGDEQLVHWDGLEWSEIEIDVFGGPSTLWGTAPDDLWGVGSFGSIVHHDGREWHAVAEQALGSPYLRTFHRVHGSSATDVWAVGSQAGEDGVVPLLWRYLPD
ncbi:beta propeller repeat protein [Paraliomyxa miuraensis]|uniref:hypothetical protein n=1 Tax=Paraliomyxa miuraensis TaxID=376150 RepID=UPI00224EF828|nr:hypothetical protein [Paraliomyxa miuraensis]MCX4242821.1 hypothetical protein [Paraliomyxa miuraensis]